MRFEGWIRITHTPYVKYQDKQVMAVLPGEIDSEQHGVALMKKTGVDCYSGLNISATR